MYLRYKISYLRYKILYLRYKFRHLQSREKTLNSLALHCSIHLPVHLPTYLFYLFATSPLDEAGLLSTWECVRNQYALAAISAASHNQSRPPTMTKK